MDPLILYTAQSAPVLEAIRRDGVCFNKACYIRKKYGDLSPLFLTVYDHYVRQAEAVVPRPAEAEYAYWAFEHPENLFVGDNATVLKLAVPRDQAVLFDLYDWNRMLQHCFLGTDEAARRAFEKELRNRGITGRDVVGTAFYPELRQQIFDSWNALLRHHDALLHGDAAGVGGVQAGLWQIRAEWILEGLPK